MPKVVSRRGNDRPFANHAAWAPCQDLGSALGITAVTPFSFVDDAWQASSLLHLLLSLLGSSHARRRIHSVTCDSRCVFLAPARLPLSSSTTASHSPRLRNGCMCSILLQRPRRSTGPALGRRERASAAHGLSELESAPAVAATSPRDPDRLGAFRSARRPSCSRGEDLGRNCPARDAAWLSTFLLSSLDTYSCLPSSSLFLVAGSLSLILALFSSLDLQPLHRWTHH
mmetsp:Transcript_10582/g.26905  ORF Transcript_10582/g.26905 Transcript_10582/m.26905 type:complete len:228 (-) Transcript_10582:317-1000(-)